VYLVVVVLIDDELTVGDDRAFAVNACDNININSLPLPLQFASSSSINSNHLAA
jgi:hypothetical protein